MGNVDQDRPEKWPVAEVTPTDTPLKPDAGKSGD